MADEEYDPALAVPETSEADLKFVDKQLAGRRAVLVTWAVKLSKKGKPDQRVLVVGEHHLFIIKKAALGRKVRIKQHWYDLDEIQFSPPHHILLVFGDESVELKSNKADEIIDAVREAYAPITLGWPDSELYEYRAPDAAFMGEISVGFGPAGNFATVYEAFCSYLKQPVLQPILDSIRAAVTYGTNVVDITSILHTGKDPPSKEILSAILPLFRTLRHNGWCEKVSLDGTKFPSAKRLAPLIGMLADTLEDNTTIETLDICGVESSAWGEVAEALAESDDHVVGGFNLPGNMFGDKIMLAFAAVIAKVESPITALNFADNACTPKGMCGLLEACTASIAHIQPVSEINVSGNRLEEAGSRALADMLTALAETDSDAGASAPIDPDTGPGMSNLYDRLTSRVRLVTLSVQNTKADVRVLLAAIRLLPSLEAVNLSGNEIAFDAVQELVQFCSTSQRLSVLALASCGLDGDTVQSILQALIGNVSLPRLRLDLSSNALSFYGAQKIADTIRAATNVHTLNLSSNALTSEGLGVIVDAVISVASLQALSVSDNVRAGTDAAEGAAHLARLITAPTNVRVLQVRGERGSELGESTPILFKALAKNRSLWHLDVSGNDMGDEGMEAICAMLRSNSSLQSLVWDGNQISVDGWSDFLRTLTDSPGMLMYVEEPKEDLKLIAKRGGALVGRCRLLVQETLTLTQRTRSKYSDRADRIPGDWPVDPVSLRFFFDYLKTVSSGADDAAASSSATGPGGAALAVGPGGAAIGGPGGPIGGSLLGGGGMVGGGGAAGPGGVVGPGGLVVAPGGAAGPPPPGGMGGGMVGGGMVGGGMVGGGMVGGGMVGGGMVGGGMVGGGMVGGGMVGGGMVGGGMVGGGMVGGGMVGGGQPGMAYATDMSGMSTGMAYATGPQTGYAGATYTDGATTYGDGTFMSSTTGMAGGPMMMGGAAPGMSSVSAGTPMAFDPSQAQYAQPQQQFAGQPQQQYAAQPQQQYAAQPQQYQQQYQ